MNLVCLDTQILIWGVKGQASSGQEGMIPKAKSFLRYLDKSGIRSLVPAIVLAELLMPIPPHSRQAFSEFMQKNFIVLPFDTKAAVHFAEIWQSKKEQQVIDELMQNPEIAKAHLKADCMIVAIALARGASCIYSHDEDVQRFGEGYIEVREMFDIYEQLELPDDE